VIRITTLVTDAMDLIFITQVSPLSINALYKSWIYFYDYHM
jgi:hypothetical protein